MKNSYWLRGELSVTSGKKKKKKSFRIYVFALSAFVRGASEEVSESASEESHGEVLTFINGTGPHCEALLF